MSSLAEFDLYMESLGNIDLVPEPEDPLLKFNENAELAGHLGWHAVNRLQDQTQDVESAFRKAMASDRKAAPAREPISDPGDWSWNEVIPETRSLEKCHADEHEPSVELVPRAQFAKLSKADRETHWIETGRWLKPDDED